MSDPFQSSINAFVPPGIVAVLVNSAAAEIPDPRADEMNILPPNASPKRRRQFSAGRAAAHLALRQLLPDDATPVLRGSDREPVWPPGVTGSIAHSADYAVVVVGSCAGSRAIGVDLESLSALSRPDLSSKICRAEELAWLESSPLDRKLRVLEIFSAKESVFKALFPLYHVYFGFKDASLRWDEEAGAFDARVLKGLDPAGGATPRLKVKVLHTAAFLLTLTVLAQPEEPAAASR